MALESTFEIIITGNKLPGRKFETLTWWLKDTVRRLDPGLKVKEYRFMGIGYRIILTGRPVFFGLIDTIQSKIKRYVSAFLSKWEYRIIVNFKERL